jgi:hypothetical protein
MRFAAALILISYLAISIGDWFVSSNWNRSLDLWREYALADNLFDYMTTTYTRIGAISLIALTVTLISGIGYAQVELVRRCAREMRRHFFQRNERKRLFLATIVMAPLFSGFQKLPNFTSNAYPSKGTFRSVKHIIEQSANEGELYTQELAKQDIIVRNEKFSAFDAKDAKILEGLHGVNVILFIIEAYGATNFENPEHLKLIQPELDQFADQLDNLGMQVTSGYFKSTTFGGSSWLAEMSFSCGLPVYEDVYYQSVMASNTNCLGRYFGKAGYRTFETRPGVSKNWPQGAFFGFDKSFYRYHLGYTGAQLGWGNPPDQYTMQYLYENGLAEAESSGSPYFAEMVLISSHAPWKEQPAFIADHTQVTADGGSIYNRPENVVTFQIDSLTFSGQAHEGYVRSVSYSLQSIADYLTQNVHRPTLILIMGDHQPIAKITGPDASWNVPVHVIASEPRLLQPFLDLGFASGMTPPTGPQPRPFADFLYWFMEQYSKSGH